VDGKLKKTPGRGDALTATGTSRDHGQDARERSREGWTRIMIHHVHETKMSIPA
jgi:hypothetical protein